MVAPTPFRSGKIDPAALPIGRFLYEVTGQSVSVVHEGEIIDSRKVGGIDGDPYSGEWMFKLQPGNEWVRSRFIFLIASLPQFPVLAPVAGSTGELGQPVSIPRENTPRKRK